MAPGHKCMKSSVKTGSSGLVVLGGDLRTRGRGFESLHGYTEWTFFALYC